MRYVTMPDARLHAITTKVKAQLHWISAAKVADFIDGGDDGWPNAEEHQEWIDSAPDDEIVGWAIAGLR